MSISLGITGGIGSGKSFVARLLNAIFSIPIYIADDRSKQLTAESPAIRQALTALLGKEVFTPEGLLNKPLLASYLFASAEHTRQINDIIHPQVRTDFLGWVQRQRSCPIVGIESAILFEAGFENVADYCVMVYAPLEVRIRRAMQRDHTSREQVLERIHRQLDDEIKKSKSHYIIVNDGETPLIPQLLSLILSIQNRENTIFGTSK